MARLRESATGAELTLLANHLVGRAERCDLVIDDARVSWGHARLSWEGSHWVVRDLGSTNHTFVNGKTLAAAEGQALKVGDTLDFGTAATWEVTDISAPLPAATAVLTGERIVSNETDILVIAPNAILYRGEAEVWHARDGRSPDGFRDGEEVELNAVRYRLSLPVVVHPTTPVVGFFGRRASDLHLTLVVAPGEDRIELNVACAGEHRALGRNGHNRMLLWLSRARLEDQAAGLPSALHGWREIEDLANHTYKEVGRVNTEVYRIRQRFAPLRLASFADIIERDESQIRLGTAHVTIVDED